MKFLILIPARTGSKGIPDKNFRVMCGFPLWMITYLQGLLAMHYIRTEFGDEVRMLVSSDDVTRFQIPEEHLHSRDSKDATDKSPIIDTINACLGDSDAVVLLQPTSPTRGADDVVACMKLYKDRGGKHPVVTGFLERTKEKGKTDSKDNPAKFHRNGSVFVIPRELLLKGKILDGEEYEYAVPKSRSIDIDDMDDFMMAEALMEWQMRRTDEDTEGVS